MTEGGTGTGRSAPATLHDVAREAGDNGGRGSRMGTEPLRDRDARGDIDRLDQAQRELGIMAILVRRVGLFLHIQVGEHAQKRRPHINAAPRAQLGEAIEAGKRRGFHGRDLFATGIPFVSLIHRY